MSKETRPKAIDRAKGILCGAIEKAQRGQPWTNDHPSQCVDAIIEAALDRVRDELAPKPQPLNEGEQTCCEKAREHEKSLWRRAAHDVEERHKKQLSDYANMCDDAAEIMSKALAPLEVQRDGMVRGAELLVKALNEARGQAQAFPNPPVDARKSK